MTALYVYVILCFFVVTNHRVYGSPFSQPDERKVHLSPRSTSHTPSSTSHHHQPPASTPPQSSNTAGRRDTPTISATKVPLTRRKWLESSIPGLVFGGGGEEERGQSVSGKEKSISGDDYEGQSSMRSQPAVPSSRCKLSSEVFHIIVALSYGYSNALVIHRHFMYLCTFAYTAIEHY